MKTILGATLGVAIATPSLAFACLNGEGYRLGYGMMGYGSGMGGFGFFMAFGGIVWTVVGILAGVWLWQQINKK